MTDRVPGCASRHGIRPLFSPALALVLTMILISSSPPAQANPLPGYFGAGFSISPSAPLDCGFDPVTSCEQIGQYCPEIGPIAIDVYVYPLAEPAQLEGEIFIDLEWEGVWLLGSEFQSCVGGTPLTIDTGNGAQVHLTLPQPVFLDFDPIRIGRLGVSADSPGQLTTSTWISVNGEPCAVLPSAAGVPCYSIFDCSNWYILCYTSFQPNTLQLTVEAGSQTSGTVTAWSDGSCTTEFDEEASWLDLSVAEVDYQTRLITASVDATGLTPGVYEARIVASTEATHACSTVRLTVTPAAQSAPDETPGEERITTWGQVKRSYR